MDLSAPGTYQLCVQVITVNGQQSQVRCTDLEVAGSVSVNDPVFQQQIQVYPNPSQGIIHIEFDFPDAVNPQMAITDLQGRMVYKTQFPTASSTYSVDLSHLPQGVYMMVFEYRNRIGIKRLLLE